MNQKNLFSTLLIIFLFIHCTNKKNKSHDDLEYSICELKIGSNISSFNLKVGDILFQDLDSDPLCDAIEIVTHGYRDQIYLT